MYEVLAYLVDSYRDLDACPQPAALSRRLMAAGFDDDEVSDALLWLHGLETARAAHVLAEDTWHESAGSFRCLSPQEAEHLPLDCQGFLLFLQQQGVCTGSVRELVLDRLMALPAGAIDLQVLKLTVVTVLWSLATELDILIADVLTDADSALLALQ